MPDDLDIAHLYQGHGHHVLRRARRLLASEEEARDVLQEVFLSLLQSPQQFERRSSVTTWLYSVTTHLCLNRIRNQRNRARLLAQGGVPDEAEPARAETATQAAALLALLPDDLAQAAVYYYIDESTHEEIALLMGCSRRHVGDLLARVKRHFAETERMQQESAT